MAIATAAELASYLQSDLDTSTAQLVLDLVEAEIAGVFGGVMPDPVPGIAKAIQLSAAARIYSNPTGNASQTTGPFSVTYGGGSILNADELLRLGRLRGLSYTISIAGPDPVPFPESV